MVQIPLNFSRKLLVAFGIQDNVAVMEMPANLLSPSSLPFPSHPNYHSNGNSTVLFALFMTERHHNLSITHILK